MITTGHQMAGRCGIESFRVEKRRAAGIRQPALRGYFSVGLPIRNRAQSRSSGRHPGFQVTQLLGMSRALPWREPGAVVIWWCWRRLALCVLRTRRCQPLFARRFLVPCSLCHIRLSATASFHTSDAGIDHILLVLLPALLHAPRSAGHRINLLAAHNNGRRVRHEIRRWQEGTERAGRHLKSALRAVSHPFVDAPGRSGRARRRRPGSAHSCAWLRPG